MTGTIQWGWKEHAGVHIVVKLELENREKIESVADIIGCSNSDLKITNYIVQCTIIVTNVIQFMNCHNVRPRNRSPSARPRKRIQPL